MIKTHDYNIADLRDRADCIPTSEPHYPVKIPVCEPDLRGNESEYVNKALRSTWISSRGEYLDRFEEEFAAKVGAKYAVAVNSGTSALMLTMAALGIGPGDEVIVPTFTMVSTVNSFVYLGATPVFVDCDEYYQMKVSDIKAKITRKTKAILPVHIYGHPVDIDMIEKVATDGRAIPVIYDAAEAHGALYFSRPIGGAGLATCYSFYGNKILTTGEGGMVVSNDKDFIDLCRNLKDVSFSTERHFWHKRLGYNFRMTNLQAAIGLAQTERFDELVSYHKINREMYSPLENIEGLSFQPEADWATSSWWMVGIEVNKSRFGFTRDELRIMLAQRGIETRTYFVPMHLQPLYYRPGERYPKAEQLSRDGLYLPSSSILVKHQIEEVVSSIQEIHESI